MDKFMELVMRQEEWLAEEYYNHLHHLQHQIMNIG